MIATASAIYIGESATIDLSGYEFTQVDNYTLIGNTSAINTSLSGLMFTYTIPVDYTPGSFVIRFNGWKDNQPYSYYARSGSGGVSHPAKLTIFNKSDKDFVPAVIEEQKEPFIQDEKLIEEEKTSIWVWIILSIVIILIIVLIVLTRNNDKGGKNEWEK